MSKLTRRELENCLLALKIEFDAALDWRLPQPQRHARWRDFLASNEVQRLSAQLSHSSGSKNLPVQKIE